MDSQTKMATAGVAVAGVAATLWWLDKSYIISQDLSNIFKLLKVKRAMGQHINNKHTIADIWQDTVSKYPKKSFILFEGYSYSYRTVDKWTNKIANWALQNGVKPGDTVALFMMNRPEYFMVWMGLQKIGCTCALINYNVKGEPLSHCLKISGAKKVIVGPEVITPIAKVSKELLTHGFKFFVWGQRCSDRKPISKKEIPTETYVPASVPEDMTSYNLLDDVIPKISDEKISHKYLKDKDFFSIALLVYTSGTTGLPKAAIIKHQRLFLAGYGFSAMFKIRENDRIYTVLPLYHSAGGILGIGMTFTTGATMILREKFSSTYFWDDCRKYKATIIQYIGELCRYLLDTPRGKNDNKNNVRLAVGNGLRPEIWAEFQKRFGIPEVGEFYGATEGNLSLMNYCTVPEAQGAVGRTGSLMKKIVRMKLVKYDVVNEEICRGPDGFAIECSYDEPGELLGLVDTNEPLTKFDGYHGNEKATSKKLARDVFVKGDLYFRTGDLLSQNKKGYWFFMDRIGDTFRWKGENVSTNEVSQVVAICPGVTEVNIYGVQIPGKDGRACMAAMVVDDQTMNWAELAKHCEKNLPLYAVPIFIRVLPKIKVTSTFKHQKVQLRKEGADPTLVKDPMYWYNNNTYEPFTLKDWEKIVMGKARL